MLALKFVDMPRTFPGRDGPLLGQQPNLSDCSFEQIRNVHGSNATNMGQVQKISLSAEKDHSIEDQAISVLHHNLRILSDPVNGSNLSGLSIDLVLKCIDCTTVEGNIHKLTGQLEMILAHLSKQPLTKRKQVHPSTLEIAKPLANFLIAARAPSTSLLEFEKGLNGTLIHSLGLFFRQDSLNARTDIQWHGTN